MKTQLEHSFITKSHNLINLFDGVRKMSTFITKLKNDAQIDPLRYDPLKYVGDGFEFFIELFLMLHPCDNRIGVYNYHPTLEDDNGVDGTGININGEKCVVQIKFRSDSQSFLTMNQDHLSNMFSDGMLKHDVVSDNKNPKNFRHFVFTTAEGLNFYTDLQSFKSKVKCIGYNDFRTLLDNNVVFWETSLEIVKNLKK